jgi:O-succinylhomoserine sulfhydrylase
MDAHSRYASELATFLEQHPRVSRVFYPGLASHPQHALAARQQTGFGGVVSFEVKGGRAAAWRLVDSLKLFSITANLGDTRSIVTHPATTTHGRLTAAQRAAMGINEELVRLSVGLEAPADLIRDLSQALDA